MEFVLPAVMVNGVVESDGPSTYQGRFRAELLINGHSVWTSEANRQNQLWSDNPNVCVASSEKSNALTQFGVSAGLSSAPSAKSTERKIALGLGQFAAGQAVEVSLVVRADAQVNKACCIKSNNGKDESFCTAATTQVLWTNTSNPVAFRTGPVL